MPYRLLLLLCAVLCASLAACSGDDTSKPDPDMTKTGEDAGTTDVGATDASTTDGSTTENSTTDTGADTGTDADADTGPTCVEDSDGDGVCDPGDVCAGSPDSADADEDGVPDGCDICPGEDDSLDRDSDGIPDGCDACMDDPDNDSDNDGICDMMDPCLLGGPSDLDGDGVADACDDCPLDNPDDTDNDGVCDSNDQCPGADDSVDNDQDGVADACDDCPLDNPDDTDNDGVCDSDDICPGSDDTADRDGDGKPDGCDLCGVGAAPEPVMTDIIFVIDNSTSMTNEIAAIETNINVNFAQILTNSSLVDPQIIMITDHGTGPYDVCVAPPLSGTTNCAGPAVEVPGKFRHYDVNIQSLDSVCLLFDTLYGSNSGGEMDEGTDDDPATADAIHPNGWAQFLRPDATKAVISISDDRMGCSWQAPGVMDGYDTGCDPTSANPNPTARAACFNDQQSTDPVASTSPAAWSAINVDNMLSTIAPAQFGSNGEKYRWYTFASMAENQNSGYLPWEPLVTTQCAGGAGLGTGYQWLSIGTEGLRYPVCAVASYAAYFAEIAADLESLADECTLTLPAQSTFDPATWRLEVTDSSGTTTELTPVADEGSCSSATEFWVEGDVATLCPLACADFVADADATADVVEPCE